MAAPVDAQRFDEFVVAQNQVYEAVRAELTAGSKTSHWMWFIFPQLAGLGHSSMARRFAIGSLAEARAYAHHGVLGMRLRECTQLVLANRNRTATEIFGAPDDVKFRSCMTLFSIAVPSETIFALAIGRFFAGERDPLTLEILRRES